MRLAVDEGIAALGLTDHDTCDGLASARAAALGAGIRLIAGIELSASEGDGEVHILGYFVDPDARGLPHFLARMRAERRARIERMIARLDRLGVHVPAEDVWGAPGTSVVGRPHLARALVRAGHAADTRDAFARYLGRGRPAYEPRPPLAPEEAVATLRAAGAAPVWAHPGAGLDDRLLKRLVAAGLAGLECWHPEHDARTSEECLRAAERFELVPTGGSDFHGHGERVPLGTVTVPLRTVDELEARSTA